MAPSQETPRFRNFSGRQYRLGPEGEVLRFDGGDEIPSGQPEIAIGVSSGDDDDDDDPLAQDREYYEVNRRASNISDIATVWMHKLPDVRYTAKIRADVEEFLMRVTMFISMVESRLCSMAVMWVKLLKFENQWADLKKYVVPLLPRDHPDDDDADDEDDGGAGDENPGGGAGDGKRRRLRHKTSME